MLADIDEQLHLSGNREVVPAHATSEREASRSRSAARFSVLDSTAAGLAWRIWRRRIEYGTVWVTPSPRHVICREYTAPPDGWRARSRTSAATRDDAHRVGRWRSTCPIKGCCDSSHQDGVSKWRRKSSQYAPRRQRGGERTKMPVRPGGIVPTTQRALKPILSR